LLTSRARPVRAGNGGITSWTFQFPRKHKDVAFFYNSVGKGGIVRKALRFALVLLIILPACNSQQTGLGPTLPSPVLNPSPPAIAAVTVGKELTDTFNGHRLTHEWTVLSGGTLVARLSWDPRPNGEKLMLTFGDTSFEGSTLTGLPLSAV
jgi:hypothetical protein